MSTIAGIFRAVGRGRWAPLPHQRIRNLLPPPGKVYLRRASRRGCRARYGPADDNFRLHVTVRPHLIHSYLATLSWHASKSMRCNGAWKRIHKDPTTPHPKSSEQARPQQKCHTRSQESPFRYYHDCVLGNTESNNISKPVGIGPEIHYHGDGLIFSNSSLRTPNTCFHTSHVCKCISVLASE